MILEIVMKKNIVILLAVCVLLMLNGCATSYTPLEKIPYQELESRSKPQEKDYTLGLALAGGGTKASSFSMGVLEGLSETEIINKTDAISSVSGGGYAALWFYSRLLNPENQELLENRHGLNNKILTFFQDCFAIRYNEIYAEQPTKKCPDEDTFFVDNGPANRDPFRHQNYIRGYQDIFSSGTDALRNPAFNMDTTGNNKLLSNDIIQLTSKTVGATVINFIPNILFDWEVPLSPSRAAYKKGILRTYGAKVDECMAKEFCDITREEGDIKWVSNELTFDKLREAYKTGEVPLWIINTTAGEYRALLNFGPPSSFTKTSYEMSPFVAGSGMYGYHVPKVNIESRADYLNELPPEEKVSDAVIMSAAFFDEQQKVLSPKFNWILKPLQSLFTLNWGYSRSNPQVSSTQRLVHKLLPWPFYYYHRFNGQNSVNIRFSDGGQSENSGAYALIRRKVSDIIISDHSQDRGGQMADVCVLKNNLENLSEEPLYVHIPGLDNLQEVCNDQEVRKGYKLGYNIFEWNHPILLGCISKSKDENSCMQDEYVTNRLYIIKAAIQKPSEDTNIGNYLTKDIDKKGCKQLEAGTPYAIKDIDSNDWKFEEEVPCELVGFRINNASGDGFNQGDQYPHFPQHSTVGLTLNSSNWVYGASRELARYYSRQLFWFFGNNADNDLIKNKFKLVLEKQSTDPIKPKHSKQGILGADVAKD